jgi:hypothetical protein
VLPNWKGSLRILQQVPQKITAFRGKGEKEG